MPVERITFSAQQSLIRDYLLKAQRDYNKISVSATTGKKVNILSDDPANLSRILSLRSQVSAQDQYGFNLTHSRSVLEYTDSRLGQMADVLGRIRNIALEGNNSTSSSTALSELVDEISNLKTEFVGYANSQFENKYIFSGTATNTQPFTGSTVSFAGNTTAIYAQLTQTLQMQMNLDGNALLMGNKATATGTTTALNLRDSGDVSLGLAAGDTITIGGTVGATALNTTITVSSSTTLSSIASSLQTALRAAGDNTETVSVTGSGTLQVTSGAGAITGLTLSVSGNTTFNTAMTFATPIAGGGATGASAALLSGTGEDIFNVIDSLSTALSDRDATDFATHLQRLDNALIQINEARATVGGRLQQVDSTENFLSSERVRILDQLSLIEDADATDVYTKLANKETVLRLVFQSASKVLSTLSSLSLNLNG